MFTNMIRMIALIVLFGLTGGSLWAQQTEQEEHLFLASQDQTSENNTTQNALLKRVIELNIFNESVENALTEIAEQLDLKLMYTEELLPKERRVSIENKRMTLYDALWEVLDGTGLQFAISPSRQLVVVKKPNNIEKPVQEVVQQTITGTVVDAETGEALPGVNIVIEGTSTGTTTNLDGEFELEVPNLQETLIFSYMGYQNLEMPIDNRTQMNIELVVDVLLGEELVVVGYGEQSREMITSSIANVSWEDFNQGAVASSPLQLVQGKIAGLAVHQANNDPAGNISFQLRGVTTVSGDREPLVIIDGVPGNINNVIPENIESIDVLRDGSAASIYGSRGTNGVIIVTTKKGGEGRLQVQYSGQMSTERLSKKPDLLTADEYRQVAQEFQTSDNSEKVTRGEAMTDFGANTDWFNEITQNPLSQVHNISVSGGSENTTFIGSINYRENQGVIKRSNNELLKGRIQMDHSIGERFKILLNLSALSREYNPTNYGVYSQALKRNPTQPVYNADGTFYETYAWDDFNPVAQIMQYDRNNEISNFQGHTEITYEIFPDLTASVMGGMWKEGNLYGFYEQRESAASVINGNDGNANRSYDQYVERILETTLRYSPGLINNVHSVEILAGYAHEDFNNEGFSAGNSSFLTDQYTYNNIGAGDYLSEGRATMSSYKYTSKLISFLGRAIYSYKSRYLLTTGLRYEGSSKFGANEKWGMFPHLSLGWRISQESFMDDVSWLNDLKIRAGIGITGNQGTDPYLSLARLGPASGRMLYNGEWIQSMGPVSNPNPDLKWETKAEYNVGIDAIMLDGRMSANLDFYHRKTSDLIYTYDVPSPPNIFNSTIANVGDMTNRGVEFSMNIIPSQSNNFQWNVDFNVSYNDNKLVKLTNDQYTFNQDYRDILVINSLGLSNVPTYRLREGNPIGDMVGYRFAGFTEEGKWLIYDQDDEVIPLTDGSEDDKAIIGNGLPKIYSGLTNTVRYKNFDASVMLRGTFGFDIMSLEALTHQNASILPLNVLHSSIESELLDTPAYISYYVEKGDFVKIDNITLGYNFNINELVKSARIYVSARNLYTFTSYSGSNPELEINGLGPGFDNRTGYPATTTFTLGFNLTF